MDANYYTRFRETQAFDTARDFVNGLAEYLLAEYQAELEAYGSDAIEGVLRSVSWDDMTRHGKRTHGPTTMIAYGYARPGLRIRIAAKFDSASQSFQDCSCRVTLGHKMNESLPDLSDQATVGFAVDERGVITPD